MLTTGQSFGEVQCSQGAAVDAAEASLARGEGTIITRESMRELAEDVNRRGRARLAVERQAPR